MGSDILVFDVNETLLDLRALRPHFKRIFGDGRVMGEWFGLMLRLSLVATVTRTYRPFDMLGKDALAITPVLAAQLNHAGLTGFFEEQISVEAVHLFKPAPETYRYAASQLGVAIGDILLVAAHDWDVTGAIRAGARGAFVARKGMFLGQSAEIPDIIGSDLLSIADQLLG